MDTLRNIIYLTGADGVKRDKTRQISLIRHDANKHLYQVIFQNSDKVFYYKEQNVQIIRNILAKKTSGTVFEYLQEVAGLSEIVNDRSENILVKNYERLRFVNAEAALSLYVDPREHKVRHFAATHPIFPFGCNNSQFKAVMNALENSLSIIQGPPGTGKTQTILNIIANLVIGRKTVLVVSNNNSAIQNVYEKLASPKCGMGFLIASLGSVENILDFLGHQQSGYPLQIKGWITDADDRKQHEKLSSTFDSLKTLFDYQEREASIKQELAQLETEYRHFVRCAEPLPNIPHKRFAKSSSATVMDVWQQVQACLDRSPDLSWWVKFRLRFRYGIGPLRFWRLAPDSVIRICKELYYVARMRELKTEIEEKENLKRRFDLGEACSLAMAYFKSVVAKRFLGRRRRVFSKEEFDRGVYEFYEEYPIVLSTTFSSRRCLPYYSSSFLFDYVIMDEASQVDVATGALALSCARNAVIVGDKRQLPNVVTTADKNRAKDILSRYSINPAYDFSKYSVLSSIESLIPDVPQTLLREHYRCHPKIINFCNQKFYGGQLVVMTEDHGESDVISVYKTNMGNHCRGHYNQRQVDVIKDEVLPGISELNADDIGIIAPYRDQARLIRESVPGIQADTVHKFQGREKAGIIISTTDDQISQFADDPNLLNVAISRAKSRLCIVLSGNELPRGSNIGDLVSYVNYNNFSVTKSRVNSIFDYLYSQYSKQRWKYIAKRISRYDSENLMYALLKDVLSEERYASLGVVFELPLRELLNREQVECLSEDERNYALNEWTHVDFMIYSKVTKDPVLAIEVDGYKYHKAGTRQAERDKVKDAILGKCGIRLLRFSTTGSKERERIESALGV